MTAPIKRPDEWNTLGDHDRRIRILEASPGGEGGGSAVFCTGCFEVPPEFADCVDLFPGACIDFSADNFPFSAPSTRPVVGAVLPIGPYSCNYQAGFRVQIRYQGSYGGLQQRLWFGSALDPAIPTGGDWTEVQGYFGLGGGSTIAVDTGWLTYDIDPTGVGTLGDPWSVYLGGSNSSVLFGGVVGPGTFCMRYIQENDVNPVPSPSVAGQILIAVGTPPVWTRLDPGTVGQVLTMGATLPGWV